MSLVSYENARNVPTSMETSFIAIDAQVQNPVPLECWVRFRPPAHLLNAVANNKVFSKLMPLLPF